jgi:hypothetical protein
MVQEVRDIKLSLEEVYYAYECYQRITPTFIANANLVSCKTVKADASVIVTVDKTDGSSPQRQELTFKGLDILKPLIRFCIENNIMLPRDGNKSILIEDDKVIMHIELDLGTDMPTALSPLQMIHVDRMSPSGNIQKIAATGKKK